MPQISELPDGSFMKGLSKVESQIISMVQKSIQDRANVEGQLQQSLNQLTEQVTQLTAMVNTLVVQVSALSQTN